MTLAEPTTSSYVRNLAALWRCDPFLAAAVEAVHPANVPPVEPTRDENITIRLPAGTSTPDAPRLVYLHSRHRPLAEADQWAASITVEDKYVAVVAGFGLGYHIRTLFARLPADAILVVAEPSIPLLHAAFENVDCSEMLATGRVIFFTTAVRSDVVERLEIRSALFVSGMQFAAHQPSVQINPAFHAEFQKIITEFVAFTRTGMLTLMLNNVTTCRNIANNLGRYVTTPPIDLMHNARVGIPAILVAAGPSLAKNMHLLPEARARGAVIIAVQTMLKPLLAAGIEPDFVTSLDYNTVSTRFFENLEEAGATGKVTLVAEPKANWNVLDVFAGTQSLIHNDFAGKLLRDPAQDRMALKAGATVAHLSFYLAEHLGCDPIILVGQDLGFVDGLYYKPGTAIHETWGVELGRFNTLETKEWERIARSKAIMRKIPDIHGHPMYTEEQFFVYLQQFERDFAASKSRVIDATEGGAAKQHVTYMTLRAAIDQFLKVVPVPPPAVSAPWKTWQCDPAKNMRAAIASLTERQASAEEMKTICEKTVPLLEEMIEKQSDSAAMDRLFAQVDRLRSRVGQDAATFQMICHLNTIGEFRRFQHDLHVRTADKDSSERQKRQLLRNVDYVKNLRIGSERLLEILIEAVRRLENQITAINDGKPWPREVAGSKSS